jgi:dTDP-4-dehydrorhamnose 3,5-epimerase
MSRNRETAISAPLDVIGAEALAKDSQTVTAEGRPLFEPIEGVRLRPAVTHTDERGTLCEMLDPAWGFDDSPLVYVYQASVLPGCVKGWVVHFEQSDRLFFSIGRIRVVLFDGRKDSPTFRRLNWFDVGELNRCLLRIPAGVYHAVQNIGSAEAFYFNMPSRAYRHDDPDKFRLPLNSDLIPYRFKNARGS